MLCHLLISSNIASSLFRFLSNELFFRRDFRLIYLASSLIQRFTKKSDNKHAEKICNFFPIYRSVNQVRVPDSFIADSGTGSKTVLTVTAASLASAEICNLSWKLTVRSCLLRHGQSFCRGFSRGLLNHLAFAVLLRRYNRVVLSTRRNERSVTARNK